MHVAKKLHRDVGHIMWHTLGAGQYHIEWLFGTTCCPDTVHLMPANTMVLKGLQGLCVTHALPVCCAHHLLPLTCCLCCRHCLCLCFVSLLLLPPPSELSASTSQLVKRPSASMHQLGASQSHPSTK